MREVREVRKQSKDLHREMLRVANGALTASWYVQGRAQRINAELPLVLVAQTQRSGGTLLTRLLDGHPEVLAFPNELKWKDGWPQVDPQKHGPLRVARSLVAGTLESARNFNLFGYTKDAPGALPSVDQQPLPFQWSEWVFVEAFLEGWETVRPQNRRQCFDVFMSAYFSALFTLPTSDKPRKLITASGAPINEEFFDDYPDGLMVSLCRNPADWYASASRHKPEFADVERTMEKWKESAEMGMRLKEHHPDHVVLVPFEALVTDPAGVMMRLAERMGIAWHPILTTPTFNGMPIGSNSSFRSVVGIDTSVLGRRNTLEPGIREQIDAQNLHLYDNFIKMTDFYSSEALELA